ncbi:MAG: hypothetical protein AB7D19_07640 [Acetobacter sp.]|uniref:hypothetical protein n=1 Tax=Acetobacter sp. TaxID=440 RepID=UPI003CFFA089
MKIEIGKPSLPPVIVTDIKQDFVMRYAGTKGDSERRITVNGLKGELHPNEEIQILTINAFCHKQNAPRSFKVSSIKELVVPETGEVITDILKWFREQEN